MAMEASFAKLAMRSSRMFTCTGKKKFHRHFPSSLCVLIQSANEHNSPSDGCEKLLKRDFNICSTCHMKGSYKATIPMMDECSDKEAFDSRSTVNHTGDDRSMQHPCAERPCTKGKKVSVMIRVPCLTIFILVYSRSTCLRLFSSVRTANFARVVRASATRGSHSITALWSWRRNLKCSRGQRVLLGLK